MKPAAAGSAVRQRRPTRSTLEKQRAVSEAVAAPERRLPGRQDSFPAPGQRSLAHDDHNDVRTMRSAA